jgi:hypothetical protein
MLCANAAHGEIQEEHDLEAPLLQLFLARISLDSWKRMKGFGKLVTRYL